MDARGTSGTRRLTLVSAVAGAYSLVRQWLRKTPPQWLLLCACLVGVALLFPYAPTVQSFGVLKEQEVSKETIIAPFTFDIPKLPEELEHERQLARQSVLLVVDIDPEVRRQCLQKMRDLRRLLAQLGERAVSDSLRSATRAGAGKVLSDASVSVLSARPALVDKAIPLADRALGRGVLAQLLVESTQQLGELRGQYNSTFPEHRIYDKAQVTLRRDSVERTVARTELPVREVVLEGIVRELRSANRLDGQALNAVYEFLAACLLPNARVNDTLTNQRREAAASEVLTIKGKVIRDTEIVRRHQEVTPEIARKLRALKEATASAGMAGERRRVVAGNVGRLLLALLPLLLVAFYLRRFHGRLAADVRHTAAIAAVILLQVLVTRASLVLLTRYFEAGTELTQLEPGYLVPVTLSSMLATILFGVQVGFVVTLYTAVFFGIVQGFDLAMFLYAMLGGLVAGFATRGIRYRWDFFRSMPPTLAMGAVVVGLHHLAGGGVAPAALLQNVGLVAASVVLSTFLAFMATSAFEKLFDVTTSLKLVELSDMNNAVLKRLSIEAAGTYNHSVLVANLAESAALRIGANALLARVASYYHDIGKLEKADYFIENTTIVERNRHSRLTPSMSALIISSHVREGVDLARRHHLPRAIRDAICQHHGTSTVSFFYEKALELDPHKQVQEDDFRYPGPRPQTRENAIIMLADSVEAASRSLATSSPRLLRELVRKIIRDKFFAAQLDQSDLTLRDLDEVVEGFMPVLQGIFHMRIEYPNR